MLAERTQIIAFFALIFGVYWMMIPLEHTADAYGYAAAMGRGELWSPHHLLYQPWTLAMSIFWLWTGVEPIFLYSLLNSLAMVLSLLVVYSLLPRRIDRRWWVVVVAFCFASLRFGTENETYAWPLFFSLWGTERLMKGHGFLAAILIAVGVLFHQIHLFWCLALVVFAWRTGRWQFKWFYVGLIASAIGVVCVYRELAMMNGQTFWMYATHDAQEGLVDFQWGLKSVALSLINLIRSFIQVHASTLALFDTPWVLVFVLAGLLMGAGLLLGIKPKSLPKAMWDRPFIWILLFQFAFAVFSQGNAEFMVMIPALMALEWSQQYRRHTHWPIVALGVGLGLWNGATLMASKTISSSSSVADRMSDLRQIEAQIDDDHFVYVARDKVLLDNYMDYKNISFNKLEIWKAPGYGSDLASINQALVENKANSPIFIDTKQVVGRQTRADWLGAEAYNEWTSDRIWDPSPIQGINGWWRLRNP
jgi:hypothetical protein